MRLRTFLIIGISVFLSFLFIFILDVNIAHAWAPISCRGPDGTVTQWTDDCCHVHKNGCWFRNRGSYIEGHVRAAYKSWGVCQFRRRDGNVWSCGSGAWQCVVDRYCAYNDRWEKLTCTKGRAVGREWGESHSELCWGWSLDARSYPSWGAHCAQYSFTRWHFIQDCGEDSWSNNYRCSGNTRQRWWIDRGCHDGGNWTGCYERGEWKNVQYCGSSYWTNDYRCSGRYRQRRYVHRGCSGSSCYSWSEWRNWQYCGSTTYGSWHYYCRGDEAWRKRTVYNRGCSGSSCYYYTSTQTQFVQDCASGPWVYYCSGNDLWRQRTVGSCSGGSCTGSTQNEFYQDCGEDYCEGWSSNYCKDNDVYRSRTCHDRGCSGTSCFDNTYQDEEKVQECGPGYWTDDYRCQGNWSQRKWIVQGCSGSSCSESSEWRNYRDCAETCYPGVLGEGCSGGTYTCQLSTGKCDFPLQGCIPPQYASQGTICECNIVKGTVIRACDGSGNCLPVTEKCDIDCGADPACQGLEPGDIYPGDPAKRCCKGQAGLPKWKEVPPF